jgi:hypothetical protein
MLKMNKLYAVITVLAISLSVGVTAMAQGKMSGKPSKKAGCSSCQTSCATPEQIKKFKADSIDLRQEMMTKRFELQRENLKDAPDSAKVTAIKAEMEAVKVKIDVLKTAAGMSVSASCCMDDCPLMDGNCDKCSTGKNCDKKGKMDCSKCSKTADCCCRNCSKDCACDKCGNASDCGCNKKRKGARK